jgi:hypothetical protein
VSRHPQPPARRLMDAAIDFAAAVEAEGDTSNEWDRLRRAAMNYREGPRPEGRPRASVSQVEEGR